MPDGLSFAGDSLRLTQTTAVLGRPTAVQTTSFTVEVADGTGATARKTLVITNQGDALAPGQVGVSYATGMFADCGVPVLATLPIRVCTLASWRCGCQEPGAECRNLCADERRRRKRPLCRLEMSLIYGPAREVDARSIAVVAPPALIAPMIYNTGIADRLPWARVRGTGR